ncbi:hypothetical protein [Paenibacillus sedimenti]|uniref:Uncharacterized protein n=1 Tax=Paenibacillus sedimenti TaxID=2770274 RepID=A0A926QH58_9BACL|nr:hypothetical protein [Paenibacillus sedimenti]MBD0379150.1 hypothetical protein [Paenibacillus sedimenti]
MKLQDALFNWLQMEIVTEARPDDEAARETRDFFALILEEDHSVSNFYIIQEDSPAIFIAYEQEGIGKKQQFDRESAEKLLEDINSNPKYNNQ